MTTDNELKQDQNNANQGTERGRELLLRSLKELGAGRSILVDKDGNVIAGNKTLEAAHKLGIKVRVVEAGRDELVAVQRGDLDLDDPTGEARRLAYLDNRVAELDLAWDPERLAADLAAGMDLDGVGFLEAELQALLQELDASGQMVDPGPEIDRAAELRVKWGVEPGQLWKLGDHRLMCGDCTVAEDVARLMQGELAAVCWTDPPYNVNYGESDHPTWKKRTMNNDNLGDEFPAFVEAFAQSIWEACVPGAILYMTMGAKEWPNVDRILREKRFHWSSTIIWVKDTHTLARKDYQAQYEPMWMGERGEEDDPIEPVWYGWKGDAARNRKVVSRKQSDVWLIDRPVKSIEHPTMKPLELVERSLRNSSLPGDIVFDPFVGSGTTLIACARLQRKGRVMDNDPAFAAVGLERWFTMMGQKPELVY